MRLAYDAVEQADENGRRATGAEIVRAVQGACRPKPPTAAQVRRAIKNLAEDGQVEVGPNLTYRVVQGRLLPAHLFLAALPEHRTTLDEFVRRLGRRVERRDFAGASTECELVLRLEVFDDHSPAHLCHEAREFGVADAVAHLAGAT